MLKPFPHAVCARAAILLLVLTASVKSAATEVSAPKPRTCNYKALKRGVVTEVLSATSLRLDDGRVLQLRSVLAPTAVDVVGGAGAWPIANAARDAVRAHAIGKNVRYSVARKRPDRYGRFAANVWLMDTAPDNTRNRASDVQGDWLQRWMLENGHARFAPYRDRSACADVLAKAETSARAAKAGLWALDAYRTHRAWKTGDLARYRNTFQIVVGTVRNVAEVRGRTFINFGKDWRSDFTAAVSKRQLRYFKRTGRNLAKLKGRRIEVRGWLDMRGGPYIEVEHTHQIRRLDHRANHRGQAH